MGDKLNDEIWRVLRPGGSTSNEVIQDVNSGRMDPLDRHVILDGLDELVDENVVTLRDNGRYHRGSRVEVVDENTVTWRDGGYVSLVEERLDNAWPRRGGRREIVRALAEEIEDVDEQRRELARALHALVHESEGARVNAVAVLSLVELVARKEGWSVDGRDS